MEQNIPPRHASFCFNAQACPGCTDPVLGIDSAAQKCSALSIVYLACLQLHALEPLRNMKVGDEMMADSVILATSCSHTRMSRPITR
jgi:hypothetical protein